MSHHSIASYLLQIAELTDEQKEYIAKVAADKEAATAEDVEVQGPTSFFHGKADKDYQVLEHGWLLGWSLGLFRRLDQLRLASCGLPPRVLRSSSRWCKFWDQGWMRCIVCTCSLISHWDQLGWGLRQPCASCLAPYRVAVAAAAAEDSKAQGPTRFIQGMIQTDQQSEGSLD